MSIELNFDYPQESVFQASLPWGISTAALAGAGTCVAVKALAAGSTALAVAGVASAFFGCYGFVAVTLTALSSDSAREFRRKIGPALKTTASVVIAEMVASVAKVVFAKILDDLIFGNQDRRRRH
jgi:hypothetical protein